MPILIAFFYNSENKLFFIRQLVDENPLPNPARRCRLEMVVARKGDYQLRWELLPTCSRAHVDFDPYQRINKISQSLTVYPGDLATSRINKPCISTADPCLVGPTPFLPLVGTKMNITNKNNTDGIKFSTKAENGTRKNLRAGVALKQMLTPLRKIGLKQILRLGKHPILLNY